MPQQSGVERAGDFRALCDQVLDIALGGVLEPLAGKVCPDTRHAADLGSREVRLGECGEEGLDVPAREDHDLVRLEHQLARLVGRPGGRGDPDHGDPHPLVLSRAYPFAQIFVPRQKEGVGDCPLMGQRHEISVDEGIHPFLLASQIDAAQAQLHVGQCGDRLVGIGPDTVPGTVVPVGAQRPEPAPLVRQLPKHRIEAGRIQGEAQAGRRVAAELASFRVDVSGVHEQRIAVHEYYP